MTLAAGRLQGPVHVWEKVEISLTAQGTYENPYTETEVWVELRGPGFERRVYGFWDGGQTYRVRVLATEPGIWHWVSGSNQRDPGLVGHSGRFEAVAWSEVERQANACRRGFLRATPNGTASSMTTGRPASCWGTRGGRHPRGGILGMTTTERDPSTLRWASRTWSASGKHRATTVSR